MTSKVATSAKNFISIPYKIKRSPTDLLKALSKTVNLEGNTPHYSVIDDTLLTHTTSLDKKKNFLAKASGIKAARYMLEKYPEGFMKDDCAPHVPKFFPEKVFTEEELKYPNEDLIYSLMSWGKFRQAYDTYLKCKDLNVEVSEACKMCLLDYLCIHNSKEEFKNIPTMEKWYNEGNLTVWELQKLSKLNLQSSWRKGGEAELLFEEMKEKSAQAYCTLIKGMAKFLEEKTATSLFNEMREKGLKPDLSTYNEMLKLARFQQGKSNQDKSQFIMDMLTDIKNDGLRPNLRTFNSALATIANFGIDQNSVVFALNILKEMEFSKIEPSLATWNSVLDIFYPEKNVGGNTNILPQIIDQVEKADLSKEGLVWKDINDGYFFKNAMDKCLNYGKNASYVHRLHDILMRNNNIKFLNNEVLSNLYFDCYLFSLMKYEAPDVLIKEWRRLTPYIHSRGIKIMTKMVQYCVNYDCFDWIPELWSNFVEGKFRRDKNFSVQTLDQFLGLMVKYVPPVTKETQVTSQASSRSQTADQVSKSQAVDPLLSQYGALCEIIMKNYPYVEPPRVQQRGGEEGAEEVDRYVFEFEWTPNMLSNFFIVACRAKRHDLVGKQLELFLSNQMKIPGELNEMCLAALFEEFYTERNVSRAVDVLNLASSYQMSNLVADFTTRLRSLRNLSAEDEELIKQLKGDFKKKKQFGNQ